MVWDRGRQEEIAAVDGPGMGDLGQILSPLLASPALCWTAWIWTSNFTGTYLSGPIGWLSGYMTQVRGYVSPILGKAGDTLRRQGVVSAVGPYPNKPGSVDLSPELLQASGAQRQAEEGTGAEGCG